MVVAVVAVTMLTTWKTRAANRRRTAGQPAAAVEFFALIDATSPAVAGTAVYMTGQGSGTPPALVHNLHYNKVLHERVVILNVVTVQQPHCSEDERFAVELVGDGIYTVRVQYGFMEEPHVPRALLAAARALGLRFDFQDVGYFLGRETLLVTSAKGMAIWREKLFVLMSRNAGRATAYFRLPLERVVELGVQVEM